MPFFTFTVNFKRTKFKKFRAIQFPHTTWRAGALIKECSLADFLSQNIDLGQYKSAKVTIELEEEEE